MSQKNSSVLEGIMQHITIWAHPALQVAEFTAICNGAIMPHLTPCDVSPDGPKAIQLTTMNLKKRRSNLIFSNLTTNITVANKTNLT